MRKIILTLIIFAVLFVTSIILNRTAYAAGGEFGSTNPNFNFSSYNTFNMGYRFKPKSNGNITQLWCIGSGGSISTVRLWDESNTTTPLASVSIDCRSGAWVSASITPVAVVTTKTYRVSQYGSSSYYTSAITSPVNITILDGVYVQSTSAYPTNTGGGYLYGYADVTFSAASSGPAVTTLSSFSYSYNYVQPYGTVNPGSSSTIYYGSSYGIGSGYSSTPCSSLPNKTGTNGPLAANSGVNSVYPSFGASPSTTYYFCVWAYDSSNSTYYYSTNTYGVTTSALPPPTVSIYPAFLVENTVANLAAGVNPYGVSSTGFFRYGTSAQYTAGGSTCSGLPNTTTNVSTGSLNGNYYPVTAKITGLLANTLYYYCFQDAGNGTGYSPVSNFTTAVTVSSGCSLLPGSSIATAGNATTLAGYLGTNNFQGQKIYQATVNGWTSANFHTVDNQGPTIMLVKNAANNKVYGYYNPISWNSTGSWTGGAGAFLFNVTDNFKLSMQNYSEYMFLGYGGYGPHIGLNGELGYTSSPLNNPWNNYSGGGTYQAPSSQGAFTYLSGTSNPTPSEIEVYKLSVCTFTGPSGVTTNAVDYAQVNEQQATINGSANPNALSTTGWFRYQPNTNPGTCNDTFGTRVPSTVGTGYALGSGSSSVSYSQQTTATLSPNTTYYYCAIASNANGTAPASNVLSFTTAPPIPTLTSPLPSATSVSAGNATISWTNQSGSGAVGYLFRIWDSTANPGGFGSNYPGGLGALCTANATNTTNDVCYSTPNGTTTTYTYTFTAGHTYSIWVHSVNSVNAVSNASSASVAANYPLNVVKNLGAGSSASVTSLDGFINCGATCSYQYTTNASVKLTAVPDGVSQLTSWSGVVCTGAGESQTSNTCTFDVGNITGSSSTVTANFSKITYLLTVAKNGGTAGLGSGTVQSNTSGGSPDGFINCGSTCTHTYDINSQVILKESPDSIATFAGWAGASCLEGNQTSATCTVLMNAAKTVTANFNSVGYTGDVTFYFGAPNQTCNPQNGANTTPALEVVVISGSTSSPTVAKYFFDPCNRVGGTLGSTSAGGSYQGVNFAYKGTVPAITHGLIMKVVPLYNSSIVGVQGTDVFPAQGKVIQSTGSAGDSARKVIYYESYPQIPNEIFPYSILSQ